MAKIFNFVKKMPILASVVFFVLILIFLNISIFHLLFWAIFLSSVSIIKFFYMAERLPIKQVFKDKELKWGIIISSFLFLFYFIFSPLFFAKQYASIAKVEEVNASNILTNNVTNIRSVTREMAEQKANKILGIKIDGVEVNTMYELSSPSIINFKGEEFWLFPLQQSGFFSWVSTDTIPGYILVSATDPKKGAKFIKKSYKISKTYLWDSINRIAYFVAKGLPVESHFEIDENGNPYWVSTVKTYRWFSIGHFVLPSFVIITNAVNGVSKKYNLDNVPSWVDKVIGEYVAQKTVEYYGKYSNGFWNSIFSKRNVVIPTDYDYKEMWLVGTKKGDLGWFTGLTSPNKKDSSLTSAVILDSKKFRIYKIADASGVTDESGAVQAAEAALGANAIRWKAVLPMPLFINNKWYWIMSLVTKETNLYQGKAAVQGDDITKVFISKNIKDLKSLLGQKTFSKKKFSSKEDKKKIILKKIDNLEKEIKELKELVNSL